MKASVEKFAVPDPEVKVLLVSTPVPLLQFARSVHPETAVHVGTLEILVTAPAVAIKRYCPGLAKTKLVYEPPTIKPLSVTGKVLSGLTVGLLTKALAVRA